MEKILKYSTREYVDSVKQNKNEQTRMTQSIGTVAPCSLSFSYVHQQSMKHASANIVIKKQDLFLSCGLPLCQNVYLCETVLMKIWKVFHEDLF